MTNNATAHFAHLINLADEALGAQALVCSDDFFASMHHLVKPGRGEFDPDAYGERGKIMDGWESRRKRETGYDWCILKLGAPGVVRLLDIDTNHFLGNHPPYASVEGTHAPMDATPEQLASATWTSVLQQVPLRSGSQNIFASHSAETLTHLRLNIFPDGGVARLRAYGDVAAQWDAPSDPELAKHAQPGEVDLAAVRNGGLALACSDSFFGPMNNLLLPGRSVNMGGGWETRRRRSPGSDWIVVRLGAPGTPTALELDTNHFKGNFPARASVELAHAPGASLTELVAPEFEWTPLLGETALSAHTRHFFRDELSAVGPATHVRLSIYPDGGISRMRVLGARR